MPGIELIGEHASLRAELDKRFSDPGEFVIVLHPAPAPADRPFVLLLASGVDAPDPVPNGALRVLPLQADLEALFAELATLLAVAAIERGRADHATAELEFRRAVALGDGEAAFLLAENLRGRGYQAAAGDAEALGLELAARAGSRERAEAAYRRGAGMGIAVAATRLGDLGGADAMEAYRRGEELGDAAAAGGIGALLEAAGDLEGAEAAYRRADDQRSSYRLGMLCERRGDTAGAAEAYGRADTIDDALTRLVAMLLRDDDLEGATDALGRSVVSAPDDEWEYREGLMAEFRGELEDAERLYEGATADHEHAEALRRLSALIGRELGDPGEARERAVAAQDAKAFYRLGLFHEGREEPAEAEAAYRAALELGHADAAYRLGGLLSGAAAQGIYERAAELGSRRAASKIDY